MSKAQTLSRLVHQRLTAAAQEICGLLEGAMSEYEEELCALKEENQRNRKLLHAVLSPEVRVQRADVQQVPPGPQGRSSSLEQEEPEPPHIKEEEQEPPHIKEEEQEPPHIKEEEQELCISPVEERSAVLWPRGKCH
ncbi:hypothetical protein EYF80_028091 [Liparis tanakae]|uniref:Uncharacterized protein n=1 Tax=Liparis tanakae TaxID=230148 RepID=A0A4Z2H7F1_9TELE|nr:hypothetical protein EYF80_028091 [Liparis tanakae]